MKPRNPQPLPKVTATEAIVIVGLIVFATFVVVLACTALAQLSRL
jgi:hypothetical protein